MEAEERLGVEERIVLEDDPSQQTIIDLYLKEGAPKVVRVTAPPGTGKTTTIFRLLKKMFLESENPVYRNFLVLTFTKRTRMDLVQKIFNLQGPRFDKKNYLLDRIRNFHSLACEILRWEKLIDTDTEKELFDSLSEDVQWSGRFSFQKEKLKKTAWKIFHKIMAECANEEQKLNEIQKLRVNPRMTPVYNLVVKLFDVFESMFSSEGAITYDYSLSKASEAIRDKKQCNSSISLQDIDLIIVDQFQDSNAAQISMIESLMQRSKKDVKLLLIGDFDQNIYNWRGAKFKAIQKFLSNYEWVRLSLNKTYRLGSCIKNVSQQLLSFDPNYRRLREEHQIDTRQLQSMNKRRDHPLQIKQFASEYSEVRWVVDEIYKHLDNGFQPKDITILMRDFKCTFFFKKLKQELLRRGQERGQPSIPYDYQGYGSSFGSSEALYLLAWLKYFYKVERNHQASPEDITRIVTSVQNIGKQDSSLKKMKERGLIDKRWIQNSKSQKKETSYRQFFLTFDRIKAIVQAKTYFKEAIYQICSILRESPWRKKKVELKEQKIIDLVDGLEALAEDIDRAEFQENPLMSVVKKIIEMQDSKEEGQLQSKDLIKEEEEKKGERKQPVVKEEQINIKEEEKKKINRRRKKELALMKELQIKANRNRMQIQTIHSAKGLQYPIVFICGLDHGYYQSDYQDDPHSNLQQQVQLREQIIEKETQELRLIYTAITRTSGFAYVTAAKGDNYNSSQPFFRRLPEHRIFYMLKQICNIQQTEPFCQEKDKPVKDYICSR